MQFSQLKKSLTNYIVFTQNDIKKIYPLFHRQRLNEWQEKGYIKKIIKGHYIFSDIEINESILFIIANEIYKPSYISLESALSYYHLIPESIYGMTSINSKDTYKFKSLLGDFIYKKIKPSMLFGYKLVKYKECTFKIAEIEKAILDYFYIKSHLKKKEDFEELRIDKEIFTEHCNKNKLLKYLRYFNNKALEKRMKAFMRYIQNA